jgi:hypothetical protein
MPIKGRSRALAKGLAARRGRDGARKPLAPSHADACNPLLQAQPTRAWDNTKAAGFPFTPVSHWFPPFVLRLAPTHLGWGTRRQFTRRSRDPPGSKRRHVCLRLIYFVVKTSVNMYDHLCVVMTMYCVFVWLRLVCGCE